MSTETEDLDVEIEEVPETDPEIVVEPVEAKKPEPAPEPVAVKPEEGLEALKAKLEREKSAREAAERQRDEAAQQAHQARSEAQDTNLHLVTNAINLVKQTAEGLKAQYRQAAQEGDFDRMADLQMEMATKASELHQLEQGKHALETAPKPVAPQRVESDPVEAMASRLTPRSAEWVRRNPQFATDQRLTQKMIAAHNLVVADGYQPDSDDYFSAVEDILKVGRRDPVAHQEEPTSSAAQPVRRQAPPAAPVSREGNTTQGSRPNVVRLTAAEREMAQMMGMSDSEYARNKVALQKEGKLH